MTRFPHFIRVRQLTSSKDPPVNKQTFGKSRLFICDVAIVLGFSGPSEPTLFLPFFFYVPLARNLEFTKTPRESFLAAYDCYLVHPTSSHTPLGAYL